MINHAVRLGPAQGLRQPAQAWFGFRRSHGAVHERRRLLEIFDEEHSHDEDRFIAVGPVARGIIVVVWTEQPADTIRIISARPATAREVESFNRHMEEPS